MFMWNVIHVSSQILGKWCSKYLGMHYVSFFVNSQSLQKEEREALTDACKALGTGW